MFRSRAATDPRDKLYGILGLATGPFAALVEPDYTRSAEDVFTDATIALVRRTGKLDVFGHLGGERNLTGLPSFVPDWTSVGKEALHGFVGTHFFQTDAVDVYNACGANGEAELKLVALGVAAVKGIEFDVVVATGAAAGDGNMISLLENWRSVIGLSSDADSTYCNTKSTREDAFWHTLCGGLLVYAHGRDQFSRPLEHDRDLAKFKKWHAWLMANSSSAEQISFDLDISSISGAISCTTDGRRFFTTAKGFFGFGPQSTTKGDTVAVLCGGHLPYVLQRERQDTSLPGQHHSEIASRVLGDCYVNGIMYGEAFKLAGGTQVSVGDVLLK